MSQNMPFYAEILRLLKRKYYHIIIGTNNCAIKATENSKVILF